MLAELAEDGATGEIANIYNEKLRCLNKKQLHEHKDFVLFIYEIFINFSH